MTTLTKLFFDVKNSNWNICLLGDTANPQKPAHKIKQVLISKGYNVFCVTESYQKIIDIPVKLNILIICMNPVKALDLLKQYNHLFEFTILQPGTESDNIRSWLRGKKMLYEETCILAFYQDLKMTTL